MKTITTTFLLITLLLSGHFIEAQSPKDGAIIKLDKTEVTIESGGEAMIGIQVLRSKRYQKSKIGLPEVGSSVEGLSYDISITDKADHYLLTIKADEALAPAKHMIVIKGDPRWGRKIRSSLLGVQVVHTGTAISSKR